MDVFLPSLWGPSAGLTNKHHLVMPKVAVEGETNSWGGLLNTHRKEGYVSEQKNLQYEPS